MVTDNLCAGRRESIPRRRPSGLLPKFGGCARLATMLDQDKQDEEIERLTSQLRTALLRLTDKPGKSPTAVKGVYLCRQTGDIQAACLYDPCVEVIAQGDKWDLAADEEYSYCEGFYMACGFDLPAETHITGATEAKPYLSLVLPLDRGLLGKLLAELKPKIGRKNFKADDKLAIGQPSVKMLSACLRLVNLLDTPDRMAEAAPEILREIHYCLLTGDEGEYFKRLGLENSPIGKAARAISWLREHFREEIYFEELAARFDIPSSSFSYYFNKAVGLSPLYYQKRLRLDETRRLMFDEKKSVKEAAEAVGYKSYTHFIKEYKQKYDETPAQTIAKKKAKTKSP